MNVINPGLSAADGCDKYVDATSVEDLDLADFVSTSNYFQCPLLPARGNN